MAQTTVWEKGATIATALSAGVAAVALWFVVVQTSATRAAVEEANEATGNARYQSVTEQWIQLHSDIAGEPTSVYFYNEKPPPLPDDPDSPQVWSLAARVLTTYEYMHFQLRELIDGVPADGSFASGSVSQNESVSEDWISWSESILETFRTGPVLCAQLADIAHVFNVEFYEAVRRSGACVLPTHPRA